MPNEHVPAVATGLPNEPSDAAVAAAMRTLRQDVLSVMHMAYIASNGLGGLLSVENAESITSRSYRFDLPLIAIEEQEWAASHVWDLAKKLLSRFEAACDGMIII